MLVTLLFTTFPAKHVDFCCFAASERAAADGSCSVTVESFSQSTTLAMAATLGIRDQLFTGQFAPPSALTSLPRVLFDEFCGINECHFHRFFHSEAGQICRIPTAIRCINL